MFRAINPATGEVVSEYEEHSGSEVERRLARAQVAFEDWSRWSLEERAALIRRAAAGFSEQRQRLSLLSPSPAETRRPR